MPKLLVEQDSFPSTVSVPVAGDPRAAGGVEVGFQALANRTRHLRNGIERIREVANKTALLALTDVTAGQWCYVVGMGLYRFEKGAVITDKEPMIIAAGGQLGNWTNVMTPAVGVLGGAVGARADGVIEPSGLHGSFGLVQATLGISTLGPIVKSGRAFTVERLLEIATDGDKTISVEDADVVISYGNMAAERVYTVADAVGYAAKAQLRIVHPTQMQKLQVIRASDGATLATGLDHNLSNLEVPYKWSILLQNTSSGWIRIG